MRAGGPAGPLGLLGLLAAGADASQLQEPLRRARAAGTSDPAELAELADLEQATMLALRIQATLAAHRRREGELAALFDTASDLAALRDLDSVLRSIVHRARMLLGSDIAYLTLHDEQAGDTYMRVTDGSISRLFRQVRLGMGEGLGGLVAQTAQPYATANYRTDARFQHIRGIDAAVDDEGLVAILGVPLQLGDRVIGVLFAADRSERTFTAEEVSLLYSLATHAAVAIESADRFAQTTAALDELHAAHDTITEHTAALQRAEQAHDRLTQLVLRGGDVSELTEAVGQLLGGQVAAFDPDGEALTATPTATPTAAPTLIAPPSAEALAATRATGRAVYTALPGKQAGARGRLGDAGRWVCAVLAGQELLGALVLEGRTELGDADRRLFERSASVTALLLLLYRSAVEAEDRVRGELLTDLLSSGGRDPAGLAARGRRLGVDLTASHVVLVARVAGCPRQRVAALAARLAFGHGLGGEYHGDAVLLLAGDDPSERAARASAELARQAGQPVTIGAGGPARGVAQVLTAHADAVRCVDALIALGRDGAAASASDLGFLGIVLGGGDATEFIRATLGPLIDYDRRRGTELVRTIETYFACGTNLNATKQALHVHVNTVVQRLDRVGALLGKNWNEPDNALEVQLALKLHRLAN